MVGLRRSGCNMCIRAVESSPDLIYSSTGIQMGHLSRVTWDAMFEAHLIEFRNTITTYGK